MERVSRPRSLTKHLLQSRTLEETARLYYSVALREVDENLSSVEEGNKLGAEKAVEEIEKVLKVPWANQADRRRRHVSPHWKNKFLKLLARKKLLYELLKWMPNRRNTRDYK